MTRHLKALWQLDALETGQTSGFGSLAGPDSLIVPAQVKLSTDGKLITWVANTKNESRRSVLVSKDLLKGFADLRGGPPEKISEFAAAWGVLFICKHGLPSTHSHSPYGSVYFGEDSTFAIERYPYCRPLGTTALDDNEGYEPVERWQFFARYVWAFLNVVARLNQGELGTASDWEILNEHSSDRTGMDILQQKLNCASIVSTWLRVGDVRPELRYEGYPESVKKPLASKGQTKLREGYVVQFATDWLRGSPLFAYLACQLMTVALGQGVGLCSGCGQIYRPLKRKPKRGQNNYCPDCGLKASWRAAASRKRANDKLERELKETKKAKKR